MVNKYKAGAMSHIIDDFLFVGPANSSQCFHLHLCQRLGFPIKDSKTVLPSKVIIIYGIEVDSEKKMECRLPQVNPCIPEHSNLILLNAIFLLAFVAFLRLGEI